LHGNAGRVGAFLRDMGTPVETGQFLPKPTFTPEEIKRIQDLNEKYGMKSYPSGFLD
jgi:hypothetical protein